MKIGILGGTFNPIHIGHLMLAETALEELRLQEVWLIPTGCSYQKEEQLRPDPSMPTVWERFEMAERAAAELPKVSCLDIEIRREGYTYSYETLEELRNLYPDDEFYFIQGADCLFAIETWKEPQRIFNSCCLAAAVRGDVSTADIEAKTEELRGKYNANIVLLPFRRLQISSTEIRERVRLGKSIRYMVPDGIHSYITQKGFYKG